MKALAAIMLLFLADPVMADTTAVYSSRSGAITVEVATNGDARVSAGPNGAYLLRKSGGVYFIEPDPSGVEHVFRSADFVAVRKGLTDDSVRHYL